MILQHIKVIAKLKYGENQSILNEARNIELITTTTNPASLIELFLSKTKTKSKQKTLTLHVYLGSYLQANRDVKRLLHLFLRKIVIIKTPQLKDQELNFKKWSHCLLTMSTQKLKIIPELHRTPCKNQMSKYYLLLLFPNNDTGLIFLKSLFSLECLTIFLSSNY